MPNGALPPTVQDRIYELYNDDETNPSYGQIRDQVLREFPELAEQGFSLSDATIHKYGTVRGLRSRRTDAARDPEPADVSPGSRFAPPTPDSSRESSRARDQGSGNDSRESARNARERDTGRGSREKPRDGPSGSSESARARGNPYSGKRFRCDDCGTEYTVEPDDPGQFPCPNDRCRAPQVFA